MYGAMKRHEIQVRRKAGQSHAQIARDAKVFLLDEAPAP